MFKTVPYIQYLFPDAFMLPLLCSCSLIFCLVSRCVTCQRFTVEKKEWIMTRSAVVSYETVGLCFFFFCITRNCSLKMNSPFFYFFLKKPLMCWLHLKPNGHILLWHTEMRRLVFVENMTLPSQVKWLSVTHAPEDESEADCMHDLHLSFNAIFELYARITGITLFLSNI